MASIRKNYKLEEAEIGPTRIKRKGLGRPQGIWYAAAAGQTVFSGSKLSTFTEEVSKAMGKDQTYWDAMKEFGEKRHYEFTQHHSLNRKLVSKNKSFDSFHADIVTTFPGPSLQPRRGLFRS